MLVLQIIFTRQVIADTCYLRPYFLKRVASNNGLPRQVLQSYCVAKPVPSCWKVISVIRGPSAFLLWLCGYAVVCDYPVVCLDQMGVGGGYSGVGKDLTGVWHQ